MVVITLDLALAKKLEKDLLERDFVLTRPPYTIFSAKKKGICCTLYQSGKLTVQGKEIQEFMEFYLEPEITKDFSYTHQGAAPLTEEESIKGQIGIDESGKGDFFGPLCIAGVYAEGAALSRLKTLGVKDSKKLSDAAIIKIGRQIEANYQYHVIRISPKTYNELYNTFRNLNSLLAWGHATTIEELVRVTGCHHVIIDQFAAESVVLHALQKKELEVDLVQRHRGEELLIVAAASILARKAFVEGMEKLSEKAGLRLPKGASQQVIAAGRMLVERHGQEALPTFAKMHFKTADAVIK